MLVIFLPLRLVYLLTANVMYISVMIETAPHSIDNVSVVTHLTFTCSKSTIETLEKGVKYV